MYSVQYRCVYRDYWYDHADSAYLSMAQQYAAELEAHGRVARILDEFGQVIYETMR